MSAGRPAYVPWFGSQLGSSQRDGPQQPDHQTVDSTTTTRTERGNKRGNKLRNVGVEKTRFLFKVKLQRVNNSKLSQKVDNTPGRGPVVSNKAKTTVRRRGGAGSDSGPVDGDIFFFSETPTPPAINQKEKAKLAVLRTISKMLEENRLIRQRLAVLSQAN